MARPQCDTPLVSTYISGASSPKLCIKIRKVLPKSRHTELLSSMGDILHHQIWTFVSLHLHDEANHMWESVKCSHFPWTYVLVGSNMEMCLALENVVCVENKDVTLSKLLYIFSIQLFFENPPHPPTHQTFLSCVLTKIPGGCFV